MKKIKRPLTIIASVAALIVIFLAAEAVSICTYAHKDERQDADVIIVLGAATWNGEVSPVFRERINHGITLYRDGLADKLIITGGYGEGNEISDSAAGRNYAVSQGVPEEDILIEEASAITQENLANAKSMMDEKGFSTAIIVSDPLHMKRAMLLAKDCGIEAYTSPTPTTMYRSTLSKLKFLAREEFFYVGYKIWRLF